ncbi:MAG: hypothetical protein E6G74_24430 [Alphaproteobacteria bacterium]|nr:MAG: hypothetical protein E6G74_24430 [Alphaproteobacteria bacterium]
MIYLGTIGLIMNFAGTVMIALSFGSNPSGGYQADTAGRRISGIVPAPKAVLVRLGSDCARVFLCQLVPEAARNFQNWPG